MVVKVSGQGAHCTSNHHVNMWSFSLSCEDAQDEVRILRIKGQLNNPGGI